MRGHEKRKNSGEENKTGEERTEWKKRTHFNQPHLFDLLTECHIFTAVKVNITVFRYGEDRVLRFDIFGKQEPVVCVRFRRSEDTLGFFRIPDFQNSCHQEKIRQELPGRSQ